MRMREEEGQATIFVALAISIFLLGAVGLAIDGSNLFWQRTMAQTAADAAAQAAMMSIFDGTNGSGTAKFTATAGSSNNCGTTAIPNASTPCVYAGDNGFKTTNGDTITVSFPADSTLPGVAFSSSDAINLVQVTVSRSVKTTLMKLLGPSATTVEAIGEAAIVTVTSPTPILITHPNLSGALQLDGSTTIQICGGPSRSIQVNSSSATALSFGGTVDLSKAGPADPGNCTTGTGADFGIFGGPTTNPGVTFNSTSSNTGHYISPASPIQDPFASVSAPSAPAAAPATKNITTAGTDGCQSPPCTLYFPGLYASMDLTKQNVLFAPGLYYIQGKSGLTVKQTTGGGLNYSSQCSGTADCPSDTNTGNGILIYDTGPSGSTLGSDPAGGINMANKNNILFQGPTTATGVPAAPYYNLTIWEDRNADANLNHQFGQGNGCIQVVGTIYITNTLATMAANNAHYQLVTYGGTPCSATIQQGDIIVSALYMHGNAQITMDLVPYGFLKIRQVALVY